MKPEARNPKSETRNPIPKTVNPKSETRDSKTETCAMNPKHSLKRLTDHTRATPEAGVTCGVESR